MSELNRRDFVVVAAGTLAAAAACACSCESAFAEAPTSAPSASSSSPIDVGTKADYPKDGTINDKLTKSNRIVVVRNEGKIYAINSTCTHKNCAVKEKNGEIVCPCHGSKYSLYGTSIKGPAKGSLFRYGISVNDAGHIIVDKSKQFPEKQWDDAAASISAT
jgi:Rieske Fe-S protein